MATKQQELMKKRKGRIADYIARGLDTQIADFSEGVSTASVNFGKAMELYQESIEDVKSQRHYLIEGTWVPEKDLPKKFDTEGVRMRYFGRIQVSKSMPGYTTAFSNAIRAFGDRGFDLLELRTQLGNPEEYRSILDQLKKHRVLTKIN